MIHMATKCSNCNEDALYEYGLTQKTSVFYCGKDLPKFLYDRKKALLIATTPTYTQAKDEALTALQSSPTEPVLTEEPEPKKRATKKKAK